MFDLQATIKWATAVLQDPAPAVTIDVSNAPAEVREAMEKLVRWEILQGGDDGVARVE